MPDQFDSCDKEKMIHQLVKVQAQVKVAPHVRHGIPKVHCIDTRIKPRFDSCNGEENDCDPACCTHNNCDFTLTQLICVEIPISFGVDVDIKKGILCCGVPHIKPGCRRHSKGDLDPDCRHDLKDDINRDPSYILMNNKVQF
jgi:hypothetical protein